MASSAVSASRQSAPSFASSPAFAQYMSQLGDITRQNNAWSAQQAQTQMQYQADQALRAQQFNSDEAAKSRAWTEYMSNTAHQREVKDLAAAGLNPVLSAMGGSGAPVTSGAVASGYSSGQGAKGDTDQSLVPALVSLLGSSIQAQTSLTNMETSARTQEAVADKYTSMSKLVAEIQRQSSLDVAGINAMASRYAADTHADATKVAAAINAAAHKYGYDVQAMTNKEIAAFNGQVNKDLQSQRIKANFDIKEAFPSSMAGLLASGFGESIFGEGTGLLGLSDVWSKIEDGLVSKFPDSIFSAKASSRRVGGGGGRGGR